jgi:hypothetical protein
MPLKGLSPDIIKTIIAYEPAHRRRMRKVLPMVRSQGMVAEQNQNMLATNPQNLTWKNCPRIYFFPFI